MLPDGGTRPTGSTGTGTSQADPGKLIEYAAIGAEMISALRAKQTAVHEALSALRGSGSEHLPALGDVDDQLDTLIADWAHLDTFVGDVGEVFQAADIGGGASTNGVVTLADHRLARIGHVGFASRTGAIAAAEAAAARFDELAGRLTRYEITREELQGLVEDLARGQYDPAFAVRFSELIGVRGYADAGAVVRSTYLDGVPAEGFAAMQVFAGVLTTALDTLPRIPAGERRDPDNSGLPDDQRLGRGFRDDLLDMDLQLGHGFDFRGSEQDLSVVLSFANPPTSLAVAIANRRLNPYLGNRSDWEPVAHLQQWGDHGDVVTNYATMLSRNDDASLEWLASSPHGETRNIERVLRAHGDANPDGGRALAEVVQNGLTHAHRDGVRQQLMEQAIETIGEQEEIRNPHMNEALARGVAHDMGVVDHVINDSWRDPHEVEDLREGPGQGAENAHVFLREVMRDEDAATVVTRAAEDHMLGRLDELPPAGPDADHDGVDNRTELLRNVGTLHGVIVAAEGNIELGSVEDYISRQEAKADSVNFLVGLVPYGGEVNDLADIAGGSAGELLFGTGMDGITETQRAVLNDSDVNNQILLALARHPERAETPVFDMSQAEREEFFQWATEPASYDGSAHDSLSIATWRAAVAFLGDT